MAFVWWTQTNAPCLRAFCTLGILATGPQAAFMTGAELSGPASHRIRASVKLTHPCQFAAAHLPCTRPPDVLYGCRPRALPGPRDRALARAFVVTRAGTDTMPTRRDDDDEITPDAASAPARGVRAPRFGPRGASMTPPAPERPATPDDLRTALRPPTSFGVTLFAINVECPADRPRPPSRIHSEDHIISQRFSPPSTGCISGGHTSLSLYW